MTKPFLFVKSPMKLADGTMIDSWELYCIGNSTLMHAAWNPEKELLVCQFNSVKENFVDVPQVNKQGKFSTSERRMEQYYRVTIADKEAVEYLVKNLCENYNGQEWDIKHVSEVPDPQTIES